jgi:hypothetical protein
MNYLNWNTKIAEHFFSQDKAGRKIYLFVTQELIEQLGQPRGVGFSDFVEGVKVGPPWVRAAGLCQRALQTKQRWREREPKLDYPPYVAYLALFVVAAGLEGEFAPNAYYPRLRTLLGEQPHTGNFPSFDRMLELWDDLERWSNVDKRGELGIFEARLRGSWIFVGVPIAQTLLSAEEVADLPLIFARTGLDPTAPPTERELCLIVADQGRQFLRNRTRQILRGGQESEAETRSALIATIFEELRSWDGVVKDAELAEAAGDSTGVLRLCCPDLDTVARTAPMILRCKASAEFPEDGLSLSATEVTASSGVAPNAELSCDEWGSGWSTPLQDASGKTLDAATIDWTRPLQLFDHRRNWKVRFMPSPVRLLVEGSGDGLSGLVEIRRLPSASKFYLLVQSNHCSKIEKWGQECCDGWREIEISHSLPHGWRLFFADRARSDGEVRDNYPLLSLPTNVSILLRGGIRVSRGNRYFDFAAPSVELRGVGVDELTFNNERISVTTAEGKYEIPQGLAPIQGEAPDKVLIEANRDSKPVDRVSVYLAHDEWTWRGINCDISLDIFGRSLPSGSNSISVQGAIARGFTAPIFDFSGLVPIAEEGTIHYIGRESGQIVHWPAEPLSSTWSPVWIIVSRRQGHAIFCGTDIQAALPLVGACKDRRRLRKWREFIWTRRKQLSLPDHRGLRKLWKEYQKVAKDV